MVVTFILKSLGKDLSIFLRLTDENQRAPLKDPLHVPVWPITRARSKKIQEDQRST
jgi:hypothetical protein